MRWTLLVPVVCLLAGFGFAVSAHDSQGGDIRPGGSANLAGLVQAAEADVHRQDAALQALQAQVSAATSQAGGGDAAVAGLQAEADRLKPAGGLTPLSGPGITVVLDDAATQIAGVDPNQLVVHQSDLQGVVNALWAGGAEAMTIAGQRVIATSAVRCVGNTLLLNGEVYSPPFRVQAVGPFDAMKDRLDRSPAVTLFKQAAEYYGLGYTVESADLSLPAYSGSIALQYAKPQGK